MAEHLKREFGEDSSLVEGDRGEFTIWVDQEKVASKQGDEFPSVEEVSVAVRSRLERKGSAQRK